MSDSEHFDVVARGAAEIAQWRDMHPGVTLELSGAELGGARLDSADLSGADLSGACLDGADLRGANLCRATLRQASLASADLSDADLTDADLSGAALQSADLSRADLAGSNLSDADLSGVFAIDADFTRARLNGSNLTSAHLTRARLIEADLTDAIVENSVVSGTVVERLQGVPRPPDVLWFDDEPRRLVTESGVLLVLNDPQTPISLDRARSFFVEPQQVELVWDHSFSDPAILAYSSFQAAARAAGAWPEDVRFLAGVVRFGRMVFLYEAPRAAAVVAALPTLLEPFKQAEFVDYHKLAKVWSRLTGETVAVERAALDERLRRAAHRLRGYTGFAENLPVEVRTTGQCAAFEFRAKAIEGPATLGSSHSSATVEFDVANAHPPAPGAGLRISVQLTESGAESSTVEFTDPA